MKFKLLIVMTEDSLSGRVIETARANGATGCTLISNARGEGLKPTKTFMGLTVAFGLRNVEDPPRALVEMARVLEPGGRIALIDVDRPTAPVVRQGHAFYFDRVVPFIGGLLSDRAAYAYLPASTAYLPAEAELLTMLRRAGFEEVRRTSHLLGAVQTLTGVRGKAT